MSRSTAVVVLCLVISVFQSFNPSIRGIFLTNLLPYILMHSGVLAHCNVPSSGSRVVGLTAVPFSVHLDLSWTLSRFFASGTAPMLSKRQ